MGHGNRTPSAALVAVLSASLLAPGAACHLDSLLSPPRGVHPTGPDSLVQLRRDSSTLIPTGGSVPETSIVMRAALRDSGLTDPVRLELEIQPVGTDFQGQATAASDPTSRTLRTRRTSASPSPTPSPPLGSCSAASPPPSRPARRCRPSRSPSWT